MGLNDRDYARDQGGGFLEGPRLGWLLLLGGLAVFAGLGYMNRGRTPPSHVAKNWPRPKLLKQHTLDLGSFDVASGEVVVCDPGYDRARVRRGGLATLVRNAAKGKWRARAVTHTIDLAGFDRCAELLAFHAGRPVPEAPTWKRIHRHVGVDSGQAGFFDWRHFHAREAVPADYPWKGKLLVPNDVWYSLCCDVTLHGDRAGVVPFGAVSSSGDGDGAYPVDALYDEEGAVIGLRLVFISTKEYETVEADEDE